MHGNLQLRSELFENQMRHIIKTVVTMPGKIQPYGCFPGQPLIFQEDNMHDVKCKVMPAFTTKTGLKAGAVVDVNTQCAKNFGCDKLTGEAVKNCSMSKGCVKVDGVVTYR